MLAFGRNRGAKESATPVQVIVEHRFYANRHFPQILGGFVPDPSPPRMSPGLDRVDTHE